MFRPITKNPLSYIKSNFFHSSNKPKDIPKYLEYILKHNVAVPILLSKLKPNPGAHKRVCYFFRIIKLKKGKNYWAW